MSILHPEESRADYVKRVGRPAQGKKELIAYFSGKQLTRAAAMRAKCYDCMGFYADGKQPCRVSRCPMSQYAPYNEKLPPENASHVHSGDVRSDFGGQRPKR